MKSSSLTVLVAALCAALAATACRSKNNDPCEGVQGACISASIQGNVTALDQIAFTLNGKPGVTPTTPAVFALPAAVALIPPAGSVGIVSITALGLLSGTAIASDAQSVLLDSSGRGKVNITFNQGVLPGSPDSGSPTETGGASGMGGVTTGTAGTDAASPASGGGGTTGVAGVPGTGAIGGGVGGTTAVPSTMAGQGGILGAGGSPPNGGSLAVGGSAGPGGAPGTGGTLTASGGSGGAGGSTDPAPPGMTWIPGGNLIAGDDLTPLEYTAAIVGFWLDTTAVTVASYAKCIDAGACSLPDTAKYCNWGIAGRDNHPITCVDWAQALAFCTWKSKRLPTEWEFEYASRYNDGRPYPWGSSIPDSTNACWDRFQTPGYACPVGQFSPTGDSALGLKDMTGNVSQWTNSWLCTSPPCATGDRRVFRGGGWVTSDPAQMRNTFRGSNSPTMRHNSVGFRCAR